MQADNEATNRRILIVDDNSAIHEDYKKILAAQSEDSALDDLTALVLGETSADAPLVNFELTSAFQGQEALECVKQAASGKKPFAVAFVDMRMPPGWDGLQTIHELWKVDPNIQIVICTAYSDYSWSEIIARVPHRDRLLILKKPFDNTEVCQLAIALAQKWELERQSRERMRAIVETAADAIITFRADGGIESCNQAACKLFGCTRDHLISTNLADLLSNAKEVGWETFLRNQLGVSAQLAQDASAQKDVAQPQQSGATGNVVELNVQKSDGTPVPVLFSLSQFTTESGPMYAAILRDLTEYKRLQRELAQSQKLESIGQLAAGVSHEINTPMQFISDNVEYINECLEKLFTVIDAYEEILEPGKPAKPWQERAEFVAQIKQQTRFGSIRDEVLQAVGESMDGIRRVIQIVRAMKQFSHLGTEEKMPTDINETIRSTLTITKNRWKYVADVQTDLDPALPEVPCLPAEINQLLLNLVVNAADAIAEAIGPDPPEKGRITLRTRHENGEIVIAVEDTGCGIPQENINRIFDPFFTTKEVGKGTGQGLTICHDVVNKHQGRIEVTSTPGQGSTFTVRIPHAEASAEAPAAADEEAELAAVEE